MVGYLFGGNTGETAESLARRRAYADALMGASQQTRAENIPQGMNQLAQALMGGLMNSQIAGQSADATREYNKLLAGLLGGPAPTETAEPTVGQRLGNLLSGKGWNSSDSASSSAPPPTAAMPGDIGSSAQDRIRANAGISGTEANAGDALQNYIANARQSESAGNAAAKNPNSSATGLYQFTTGTWSDLGKKYPALGLTADGRLDPAQQELAMQAFTLDNAQALKNFGIPVNGGSLYAMHFLGGGAAPRVLSAPAETRMTSLVPSAVIEANPFLANMTAGDFSKWAAQKGGEGSARAEQAYNVPTPASQQAIPGDNWNLPFNANPRFSGDAANTAAQRVANAENVFPGFTGQQPSAPPQALAMSPQGRPQQTPQPAPQRPISTAGMNYDPATGRVGPAAGLNAGATLAPAAAEAFLGHGGGQAMMPQNSPQMPAQAQGSVQSVAMPQGGGAAPQGQQGGASAIPGINPQIAAFIQQLNNPYLDERTRAAGQQMLQLILQQNDPMRQLQMEKLRRDVNTPNLINAGKGALYDPATGQWITPPAGVGNDAAEYGLNPQYGVDANGNPVILQLNKAGAATTTKLPEGVQLSKEPIKLDAGTEYVLLDPITRQPVGRIPKDIAGQASATAQGKAQGEAAAAYPQVEEAANNMLGTIDSLLNDPYLDSMVGAVDTWRPNVSSSAARVQSKMDQIRGQSFLQAFNSLRGGGQITEVEGQKATDALARMNTAQSESDYKSALNELRGIIQSGVNRARQKAGMQAPTADQPQTQPRGTIGLGQNFPGQPGGSPAIDDLLKKYGAK